MKFQSNFSLFLKHGSFDPTSSGLTSGALVLVPLTRPSLPAFVYQTGVTERIIPCPCPVSQQSSCIPHGVKLSFFWSLLTFFVSVLVRISSIGCGSNSLQNSRQPAGSSPRSHSVTQAPSILWLHPPLCPWSPLCSACGARGMQEKV